MESGDHLRSFAVIALAVLLSACASTPPALTEAEINHALRLSPVPSPPADPSNRWADDPSAAALGRRFFHDTRLSANGKVSCATCHRAELAFTDGLKMSVGVGRAERNAPTLWNVAHQRWLFWDGRADTLWGQALGPLENPVEHGGHRGQYAELIRADEGLRTQYEGVFGPIADDATEVLVNMGKAIAAFERTLASPPAPFDLFVEDLRHGNAGSSALPLDAVAGLKLFLGRAKCSICHDGPIFSDLEFHDIGIERSPTDRGRPAGISKLLGSEFTGISEWSDAPDGPARTQIEFLNRDATEVRFKTPTLRNVALTAPYMHRGQLSSLEEVVRFYSTLKDADLSGTTEQILTPLNLDEREISQLVAFLESLTSE